MRILVLVVLALLSVSGVGAQEALPPYIHYFDHLRGGLVIERADGTDSRMIPDVPMDAGPPVWSPSGKWMVIGNEIISTDGTKTSPYPQPIYYEHVRQWAPNDDLLLIAGTDGREGTIHSRIYDVRTQTILADITVQYWGFDPPHPVTVSWTSDGQSAFVHWADHLVTLDRDGRSRVRVDAWPRYPFEFHRGRLMTMETFDEPLRGAIAMRDMETGELVELQDEAGWPSEPATVRWSPTLDHALIYAADCSEESCRNSLRLLEWDTGRLTTITPAAPIPADNMYCADQPICANLWSPSGRFASLTDENSNVYVLDVTTGTIEALPAKPSYFEWLSGDKLLWPYNGLYIYDPTTGDQTEAIELPDETSQHGYFPSPDGRYIALTTRTPTVIDQTGMVAAQTTPHSYSTQAVCCPYSYAWHSGSQWLIAEYIISFAGGGGGPIAAVLFDIEGNTRRELPQGGFSGFVPDYAIINYLPTGQITSGKKEPIFTLPQRGIVDGVGWHPTDPDQLVTYSREGGLIYWSLAGSEPEIIRQEILAFPFPGQLPIGLRLFWLPEQDVVAFWNGFQIVTVNQQNGELERIEGVDYAWFETTSESRIVRCSISDHMLEIETALDLISCGQTSILYRAPDLDSPVIYADIDTQVITALDIGGRSNVWTGDARKGIAVIGGIYDCCFAVTSTETGALLDEFHGTAYHLAISADGRRPATTSAGMTAIWDISEYMEGD